MRDPEEEGGIDVALERERALCLGKGDFGIANRLTRPGGHRPSVGARERVCESLAQLDRLAGALDRLRGVTTRAERKSEAGERANARIVVAVAEGHLVMRFRLVDGDTALRGHDRVVDAPTDDRIGPLRVEGLKRQRVVPFTGRDLQHLFDDAPSPPQVPAGRVEYPQTEVDGELLPRRGRF